MTKEKITFCSKGLQKLGTVLNVLPTKSILDLFIKGGNVYFLIFKYLFPVVGTSFFFQVSFYLCLEEFIEFHMNLSIFLLLLILCHLLFTTFRPRLSIFSYDDPKRVGRGRECGSLGRDLLSHSLLLMFIGVFPSSPTTPPPNENSTMKK